jgi:restriction endonuclease
MKVFIAYSARDRALVTEVIDLLGQEGNEVVDPMAMEVARDISSQISSTLISSDAVVAIMTVGNPNIYYELGLAAGAGVPTLVVAPAHERLPIALTAVPYIQLIGDISRDAQAIARRVNEIGRPTPALPRKFDSAEVALHAAVREPAILESLSPLGFGRLLLQMFRERGYAVKVEEQSSDIGVDFAIESQTPKAVILVQVKKLSRQSRVSVESIRQLQVAVSAAGARRGLLVATSGYTAAAVALAADSPIILRTLDEVLAAKSESELFELESHDG